MKPKQKKKKKKKMNELEKRPENNVFSNSENFEQAQRVAKLLSSSSIVPQNYQNNIPNTLVALEMSNRIGVSPLMVMQNLDIIKGKPSWNSQFIISALNSCGRFSPLRFGWVGEKGSDSFGCFAYAHATVDNVRIQGPTITWKMVKTEGWFSKKDRNGRETSKWQSMPELMFQYRAAAFFGRLHAPDILQGMHSANEQHDIETNKTSQKDHDAPTIIVQMNEDATGAKTPPEENDELI